jgi:hypothetical protein
MMLRVVLVGIVAGLGISPPSESELTGWTRSVQTWLDAGLLAFNAEDLTGEDQGAGEDAVDAPTADDVIPEASTPAPAKVAMPLSDADDLSEDDDQPAAPVASEDDDQPAAPVAVTDEDEEATTPTGDSAAAEAVAFDAVIDEMVADFSRAEVRPRPTADDLAGLDFDDAMELVAGAIANVPAQPRADPETKGDQPLEIDDELYPGEAYVLNREADGLPDSAQVSPDRESEDAAGHASADRQLNHAVRLTRDAVYAWINLLQSPAIVTISH